MTRAVYKIKTSSGPPAALSVDIRGDPDLLSDILAFGIAAKFLSDSSIDRPDTTITVKNGVIRIECEQSKQAACIGTECVYLTSSSWLWAARHVR